MRKLTRQQIESATKEHKEISSIVIHATGMIIKPRIMREMIEPTVRYWLLKEIEPMPLKMRQEVFLKTMDREMHTI